MRLAQFPFQQVNNVLKHLNTNFSRINSGGCGAMAHILGRNLEKVGYTVRIAIYSGWGNAPKHNTSLSIIRRRLRSTPRSEWSLQLWDDVGIGWGHVWAEFFIDDEWFSIDSTGIETVKEDTGHGRWGKPLMERLSIEDLALVAYRCSGWNRAFDRNQIPAMAKFVGNSFKEIFHG